MRYENWDILLFPEGSKIPIQEFKTSCHVVSGADTAPNRAARFAKTSNGVLPPAVPILTTFIGSMNRGAPFGVSVHCWRHPNPSPLLASLMIPDDNVVLEASVYIDGILATTDVFDHRTEWPVVVSRSSNMGLPGQNQSTIESNDRNSYLETGGHIESLRFPPFHQSILREEHWEAGESFGRIKIVITEGLARSCTSTLPHCAVFDRFRDVIAFSFQHAPTTILEFSGIAWPNPSIFKQVEKNSAIYLTSGGRPPASFGDTLRGHSPRHPAPALTTGTVGSFGHAALCAVRNCTSPIDFAATRTDLHPLYNSKRVTPGSMPKGPSHSTLGTGDDPFIGPPRQLATTKRSYNPQKRNKGLDVSMQDYSASRSESARSYTDMSGISYSPEDFNKTVNEAASEEIVKAMTPARKNDLASALNAEKLNANDTHPRTNTPSSVPRAIASISPGDATLAVTDSGGVKLKDLADGSASLVSFSGFHSSSKPKRAANTLRGTGHGESPISNIQDGKDRTGAKEDEGYDLEAPASPPQGLIAFGSTEGSQPHVALKSVETSRRGSTLNASKRKRSLSRSTE